MERLLPWHVKGYEPNKLYEFAVFTCVSILNALYLVPMVAAVVATTLLVGKVIL